MKHTIKTLCFLLFLGTAVSYGASAQTTSAVVVSSCGTPPITYVAGQAYPQTQDTTGKQCTSTGSGPSTVIASLSGTITNPTSTLTLTSATTAYSAGQLIANSATAGSITVPSFAIANSAGGATIPRLRLSINDTTSTAWGNVTINVDLWTAAPTWTNGDRATWLPATGSASHLGTYSCVMSAVWGDGVAGECAPLVATTITPKLAAGTSIFWSLEAVTASGVTGASKTATLAAEVWN